VKVKAKINRAKNRIGLYTPIAYQPVHYELSTVQRGMWLCWVNNNINKWVYLYG
jgi:hypothetical protein